ncbi:MAG: putative metal-dependent hydrolase [Bacteroidota bacterium]
MNTSAMIDAIAALPDQVEASVKGLNDSQLDTQYREGGWTVRQVIHHLADSHMNAFIRMKLILTEENPTLKPYDQDLWAAQADVQSVPIGNSLSIIRGLHDRWVRLLRAVPEYSWTRSAIHPERGVVTLGDMLKTYSNHGAKHVETILALRRSRAW